jgi:probable HAF family extracellular repeat protein
MIQLRTRQSAKPARQTSRLALEPLEDRQLLSFTVVDLGTFGGSNSIAYGINENGHVVGNADLPNGQPRSFHWTAADGLVELQSLGGTQSNAFAINDNNVIVGISQLSDPTQTHAVRWTNGVPQDLGTLGGGPRSTAFSITLDGRIVGQTNISPDPPLQTHAFFYQSSMVDLGKFPNGNFSSAQAINEAGRIAGYASPTGNSPHNAFLYEDGQMKNLGTLGGNDSKAYAINESSQVVGSSLLPNGSRTSFFYVYARKQMKDIGTLGGLSSEAFAINDHTHIVGTSLTATGEAHAYLWRFGHMFDLNTLYPDSGWTFVSARGINNKGQIVGVGINPNLESHAFLLTPDERANHSSPRTLAITASPPVRQIDRLVGTSGSSRAPLTSARSATEMAETVTAPETRSVAARPAVFRADVHAGASALPLVLGGLGDPLTL